MNNPKALRMLSFTAFAISMVFTILLMTSSTVGILAFVLTTGMAIILELSKMGFFYEAIRNNTLHLPIRISLAIIAFLLVCASIFASAGFVQNQANTTKNMQTKTSTQYKNMEEGRKIQQDLYATKKKEIESLEALKIQQQQEGEKIVSNMPKNYIDRKNLQRSETQNKIAKTQELINQKSSELSSIASALQSPIDTNNIAINDDKGYASMFKVMASWTNTNPESLELWFYIALSIIFEIVAVLTAYLAQVKGDTFFNNPPKNKIARPKIEEVEKPLENIKIEEPKNRLVGWKFKKKSNVLFIKNNKSARPKNNKPFANSNIDESDIQKYIMFVNENQKNGTAPGRTKIAAGTGIPQEKCRTIHNILIDRGILETADKCTKIKAVAL